MTPIRKGTNPVKIPFQIRTSDKILAQWTGEVRKALQALEARIPTAPLGKASSGAGERPPFWGTLSKVPESDPAEYQVTFQLGYLTYQNATATAAEQGVVGYLVPKINGVAMDDPAVEPLELPAVVSYVYLRVKTDQDGAPDFAIEGGPVTIEAFDAVQESVHHVRESPTSDPVEGDYYFLLLETEEIPDSDPAAPRVKRRLTGNRYLPNQLVFIENVGGQRELYKGYQVGPDDKHEFRTLEQLTGTGGAEILRPEGESGEGDTIPVRYLKKDNESVVPYVIEGEEDNINVRFEGSDDTYSDPFGGSISFKKGICDSVTNPDFAGGWWGTVGFQFDPGGGASLQTLTLDFEAGILVAVACSQGVTGAGTEASPGDVVFQTGA